MSEYAEFTASSNASHAAVAATGSSTASRPVISDGFTAPMVGHSVIKIRRFTAKPGAAQRFHGKQAPSVY